MYRRRFLAASALLPLAAGCQRDPAAALVSTADAARIKAEQAARESHLAALASMKVPTNATFTSPPRPANLVNVIPEARVQRKAAVRLHPHYSDEPAATESKIGGAILWPAAEAWPTCERFRIRYVPVLQLLAEDCPTQVKFKPGADVLQLLWCPRDFDGHGPKPLLVWRNRKDVREVAALPPTAFVLPGLVPVPCRVYPEQILEFPDWHTLKVTPAREKLEAWKPPGGGDPVAYYSTHLSAAPGTKVGGYPRWLGEPAPPSCDTCKRGMDFVLTLDTDERREASWVPKEEAAGGSGNAPGLTLSGNWHLFVCRRCPDWPAKAAS